MLAWLSALFGLLLSRVISEPFVFSLNQTPNGNVMADAIEGADPSLDGGRIILLLRMFAVVLAVALAFGRLYRRSQTVYRPPITELRDARKLGSPSSLKERLLSRLGMLGQWRAAFSIRRIYQEMSATASIVGYPRAETETPFEYLASLKKVWPGNTQDSQTITEAYVRVRYGELPETRQELDHILAAWKRLRQIQPATVD